ncbi:rab family small GTPase [Naegleria gruberi]|uniref:Rab family small GTPase n=1 Tax=Naegleria gruberi TaxID=5762 RepID=D2V7G1_NAEGR|nr:rab family small GTPase [Naegleria gruberi]EFC47245.1 rab family small GTPase [Naegleria gruberi]|eukprot:XP_002679989.1 rab family small GTPase [Naegleria gruberi strain NEG-M]
MGQASTQEKGTKSSMMDADDDEILNNNNSKTTATTHHPTTSSTTSATSSNTVGSKNKINESIQIVSIEKENEEEYDYLVKVVLVGDYGVGKTSLAKKISQRGFTTQHQPTIGIDFVVCTLILNTKETVRLQLWDTAGQEKFKALASSFFRGADGIFVIADISEKSSFDRVPGFLEDGKKNCTDDVEFIFIASKTDLRSIGSSTQVLSEEDTKREFRKYDSQIPIIETSAKEDKNVEKALLTIIQRIYNKKKEAKK